MFSSPLALSERSESKGQTIVLRPSAGPGDETGMMVRGCVVSCAYRPDGSAREVHAACRLSPDRARRAPTTRPRSPAESPRRFLDGWPRRTRRPVRGGTRARPPLVLWVPPSFDRPSLADARVERDG